MPTLVTNVDETVTEFPLAVVEYKTYLTDAAWLAVPFLFCDKLKLAVNAYDEAELTRYVGDLIQPGDTVFQEWEPVSLIGKYVRVTIPQEDGLDDLVWVGYVVGSAVERSAVKGPIPAANKLQGNQQVLTAVGLEYFLDRVQIDSAYLYDADSPPQILRSIPFNGGQGVALDADTRTRANRSAATTADGTYAFVPADETGELWTLGNIIYYLLSFFAPRSAVGSFAPVTYSIDPVDVLAATLDGIAPTFDPDGLTIFQVLNKLVSPQRGFVWWLEYVEGGLVGPQGFIRVETISGSAITLPSLGTIPANRDQQTLDFDRERDVDNVIVAKVGSRHYHQIICRGARFTSTCTLAELWHGSPATLTEDWDADLESEYYDAADATAGYDDLSEGEQADRNDAARQAERLARVYSYFRIPTTWNGRTLNDDPVFPQLDLAGGVTGTVEFSVNGLRLLNHTRLKRGWNYANTAAIEETTPTGTEADYMPLLAILQVANEDPSTDPTTPPKYQLVEKLGHAEFAAGTAVSDKITVSYDLHAQTTVPGVILNAHGAQHAIALNHFDSEGPPTNTQPQVDYETLRVTCTIEADSYCEARYPEDADLPADVPLEKLLLYVGEEYRLDYLVPNSVVDLANGEPVLTNGGVLRDDRKRLQDIARVAYEWYQLDRQPVTLRFKQLRNIWRLGMLITTLGEGTTQENVNTVVSMITYDCAKGITTIQTQDAALDIARLT